MAEKKDAAGAEGAAKPKSKRPLIIIMVVVVLLLGAGTFVIGKQVAAKGAGHKKKHVEKGPVLALDEFLVNLADPGGDHFLKVTIGLELDKEKGKTAEGMKEQIAPIRDAVLTALTSKTRDQVDPLAGREALKAEIKKRVNAALGEEDIRSVYFTNFVSQ